MAVYDKCGKLIKSSVRDDFKRGLQNIMKEKHAEFADGTFEDNMVDIYDNYVSQYYEEELEKEGGEAVAKDWFRDTYYDDEEGIFIHNSKKPIKSSEETDRVHSFAFDFIITDPTLGSANEARDRILHDIELVDGIEIVGNPNIDPMSWSKEEYGISSSRKPIKSSNLIKSNVEIDDDIFIELLWDRVNSFTPAKGYDEEFWTECFDYLSEIGWMGDPWKNDPKYIVDNIAVNGEIFALEDCADNYDEINDDYKGDVNAWIEDNGYLVFGDYVVINLGL